MATPHAPIAILQSHLQALYNIILTFVIAISLFLGYRGLCGRRGRHCNSTTGRTGGGQKCRKRQLQRGRWPKRRLHCYTKVGSRNRGLVAERGSFESLTDVSQIWSLIMELPPNNRLNYRFKWAMVVAATNYKTGDTKRRTDWTDMKWRRFATKHPLNCPPLLVNFNNFAPLNKKLQLLNRGLLTLK